MKRPNCLDLHSIAYLIFSSCALLILLRRSLRTLFLCICLCSVCASQSLCVGFFLFVCCLSISVSCLSHTLAFMFSLHETLDSAKRSVKESCESPLLYCSFRCKGLLSNDSSSDRRSLSATQRVTVYGK